MADNVLQTNPEDLARWAIAHDRAADACADARSDHPRAVEAAGSWGPLFYEARRATVDAVNARETALLVQEARHRETAQQLRVGAARLDQMNAQNRANLTIE